MDKNPDRTGAKQSHFVPPERVINEVIQSIEKVDRKIEEFYEIHGKELLVTPDSRPDFR